MITHSYSEECDPPCPIVPIKISSIIHPDRVLEKTALLDTGADISAIPPSIIQELQINEIDYVPVEGVKGTEKRTKLYVLNIEFNGKSFNEHLVIEFADEDYLLIGRDIMNDFHICFDGINLNVNIHENEYKNLATNKNN